MQSAELKYDGLPAASYEYGVAVGETIWLAGQLGVGADGAPVSTEPAVQAEQCIANIEALLGSADATLGDLVQMRIYVTHWAFREPAKAAIQKRFPGKRPPTTTLVVTSLASPDCFVEVEGVAVRGLGFREVAGERTGEQ